MFSERFDSTESLCTIKIKSFNSHQKYLIIVNGMNKYTNFTLINNRHICVKKEINEIL